MKQGDSTYRPNYFLILAGLCIAAFLAGAIIFAFTIDNGHGFKAIDYMIAGLVLSIFIRCSIMCLDAWEVRVSKGTISLKRPWSGKWTEIDTGTFRKIQFQAGLDDHMVLYKKLTLHLNDNSRFNLYSYSESQGDSLYMAILHQSPALPDDYKKRKGEIENKAWAWRKKS
jgi:hypothetical protein